MDVIREIVDEIDILHLWPGDDLDVRKLNSEQSEHLGIPVSTTHTITGSIIGVGATKRLSAVRWGVTINLLWAWILTIPVSALLAAIVYFIVSVVR